MLCFRPYASACVVNIIQLFHKAAYDRAQVQAMGEAYDLTRETVLRLNHPEFDDDSIAKAVLSIAETGERNSADLCWGALKFLGVVDRSELALASVKKSRL